MLLKWKCDGSNKRRPVWRVAHLVDRKMYYLSAEKGADGWHTKSLHYDGLFPVVARLGVHENSIRARVALETYVHLL